MKSKQHPETENTENMTENGSLHDGEKKKHKKDKRLKKIEELEARVEDLNNKYLRLYSDFENYRRRTAREKLELIDSANRDLLLKILPVIDDFQRAIASNADIDDPAALKEGIEHIYNKLRGILEQEGVKAMETVGKPFDMELQEAVARFPAPKKSLKGKVIDETEKGYFLKDKVLRYAKVVVGD